MKSPSSSQSDYRDMKSENARENVHSMDCMENYVTWLAAVSAQGRYRPIWFRLVRQWLPANVVLISVCEHPMQERGFQQIRYSEVKQ